MIDLDSNWDVIIIGGDITGAGVFRETVRMGLKSLLLDQQDFSWGTSSRSSKLVHGGLRYLKEDRIFLARDAVRERERDHCGRRFYTPPPMRRSIICRTFSFGVSGWVY